MTEQEYDDEIAPALADIAKRVDALGGSLVARIEWEPGEAGITKIGVSDESGVAQRLAAMACLCNGNLDLLYIQASRKFDMSQTIVGSLLTTSA